jgi:outer membrane protein assembly factor BamE
MSRNHLVSVLFLGLLTACSSVNLGSLGPHRIDVQQGNALDQESVAKLKPGLTRSQVRFLLGTPLVVDPFRGNRWDYVYAFYKRGQLTEQKRITLFFDGDTLARIEGDVPAGTAALTQSGSSSPASLPAIAVSNPSVESLPLEPVKKPEPIANVAPAKSESSAIARAEPAPALVAPAPVIAPAVQEPQVMADRASAQPPVTPSPRPVTTTPVVRPATSVVPPLSNVPSDPVYGALPPKDLVLHPETNVALIQPDVIPPFPEPNNSPATAPTQASVLSALKVWSDAWAQGNADAYIAAYAADFSPPGGESHADWEKRRRMLLGVAQNVELRIAAPKVKMAANSQALVTFTQYYRSKSYRDDLVKQIKLVQRGGHWLIVDERVVSTLQAPKP